MQPLKIDVSELLESPGEVLEFESELAFDSLTVGEETFASRGPARISLILANAGSGIVASGSVSADVTATCARCLCAFETTIEGDVEGFYTVHRAGSPEDDESEDIHADGTIDLTPAIQAALVIEAPFAPLHDEACKGLCPTCGADLNAGECRCAAPVDESHPFAGLKDMLGGDQVDDH